VLTLRMARRKARPQDPRYLECPRCTKRVLVANYPRHQMLGCRISPGMAAIFSEFLDAQPPDPKDDDESKSS
jgi:hypothetical protein